MELRDLIQFANEYAGLGWSIHKQAQDMFVHGDYSDINPNAAAEVERLLVSWGFDEEAAEMMELVADNQPEE